MENVPYNCTLTYGTCASFGIFIHFALMYASYQIFLVILVKDLINEDGEPTKPFKLVTGTKPSVLHLQISFFPCVVRKTPTHVGTNPLNMRHQMPKGFCGISVGIPQHQKGPQTQYCIFV